MRAFFDRRFWVLEVAALALAALFTAVGVGELLAGTIAARFGATGSTAANGPQARVIGAVLPGGGGRSSLSDNAPHNNSSLVLANASRSCCASASG